MEFDTNTVLADHQQHTGSQNKNKGQDGFTLGQEGKRWVFQKSEGEVATLDTNSPSLRSLGIGVLSGHNGVTVIGHVILNSELQHVHVRRG